MAVTVCHKKTKKRRPERLDKNGISGQPEEGTGAQSLPV